LLQPLDSLSPYLRSHLRYPEDLFTAQAEAYTQVHVRDPGVYFNGSDRYQIAQEQINGQQQNTKAYYIEATLPGESSPQFLLFQTFSPGASGSGTAANNMTAWLAAENDYTTTNHPSLVAVRLNNADNVLGPLQFDNNINSDPTISSQRTLLSQAGSQVILGNVIVLPFNNDSFLYVRPFYVDGHQLSPAPLRHRRHTERRRERHVIQRCRAEAAEHDATDTGPAHIARRLAEPISVTRSLGVTITITVAQRTAESADHQRPQPARR
jgi:uncharacterized membrane protein (UPF0182 family)